MVGLLHTACALALALSTQEPVVLQPDWFFTNHMVLQQGRSIPFTGRGRPGEQVSVEFASDRAEGLVDRDGRFELRLGPFESSTESRVLVFTSAEASVEFSDVLVGDLWVVGGASPQDYGGPLADGPSSTLRLTRRTVNPRENRTALDEPTLGALNEAIVLRARGSGLREPANPVPNAYALFARLRSREHGPQGFLELAIQDADLECWVPREHLAGDESLSSLAGDYLQSPLCEKPIRSLIRTHLRKWILSDRSSPRPTHPLAPGVLFEQRVAPLAGFPIRGVLWPSAPGVTHDAETYERLALAVIASWRQAWGDPQLPFLWFQEPSRSSRETPRLREAQDRLALDSHIEPIVTFDLESQGTGQAWIQLGNRLAHAARDFARPLGPIHSGTETTADELLLERNHLRAVQWLDGREGLGFEVAGEDLRFYPALAVLEDRSIRLRSPEVKVPVAARYAWDPSPVPSLLSLDLGHVAPFRTHPVEPIKVACIGDSLTLGLGLEHREDEAYPEQLGRFLGDRFLVRNFSRSATTAGTSRFPGAWDPTYDTTPEYREALAFDPDIVVCNLGTNDLTSWSGSGPGRADQFVDSYCDLLASFQRREDSPELWIWSPIAPLYPGQANHGDEREAQLNASLQRVTERSGARGIDMHAWLAGHPEWFPDKLHPTASGCRAIAAAVQSSLAPLHPEVPSAPRIRLFLLDVSDEPEEADADSEKSDGITTRLVLEPNDRFPGTRVLRRPSGASSRLGGLLATALWKSGIRDFAVLPFRGGPAELEAALAQTRREWPRPGLLQPEWLGFSTPELETWRPELELLRDSLPAGLCQQPLEVQMALLDACVERWFDARGLPR